jgi:hypothetical protein
MARSAAEAAGFVAEAAGSVAGAVRFVVGAAAVRLADGVTQSAAESVQRLPPCTDREGWAVDCCFASI